MAGRNPENIAKLEQIDKDALTVTKKAEKEYYQKHLPEIRRHEREFVEEFKKENENLVKELKLEYLESLQEKLNSRIKKIWEQYERTLRKNLPYWFRKSLMNIQSLRRLEKIRKKTQTEIYFLKHQNEIKRKRLTPEEIARAKDHPFGDLIEVSAQGLALCPFHEEKNPSFFVRNNWGYCFGCHWSGDIIKFIMDKDKISFVEAVKRLNSI